AADVEEFTLRESEHAGKNRGRELLDSGVVFLHGVVEEAARGGELVFDVGQVRLQLLEVRVGLQVRIVFRQCEKLPQRSAEHVFRRDLLLDARRGDSHIARLDDRLQRPALVRGVSLYRLHQIGDQVVALLELHIDVGEGLVGPLPHGDQAVVDADGPYNDYDNDAEDDPAGCRHETLLKRGGTGRAYPRLEPARQRQLGVTR